MSTPTQANSGQTPVTGTKRRYLGVARRKRTADISFSEGDVLKQCHVDCDHHDHACHGDLMPDEQKSDKTCDRPTSTCHVAESTNLKTNHLRTPSFTPTSRKGPRKMHLQSSCSVGVGEKKMVGTEESSASPGSSQSAQTLQSTPIHRFPSRHTMGSSTSARKRFRHDDFKSPMRNPPESPKPTNTVESLSEEVNKLQQTANELESEIASLTNEGYCEDELQTHIEKMHEYNELKDTGQMLLGQIALIEGVTTKHLYARYGLGLDD